MDFQNRVGGKTGSGGVASASESNRDRRERLRQLALETIDLKKDPYFMMNHLGSYECKLCLTIHTNESSYLAHTQGKKHQCNLARRAAKDAKDNNLLPQLSSKSRVDVKKFVKIGRPGYRITKQLDPANNQQSLLFQIDYPEIADNIIPRHRFMSAYEQKIEPPDRHWQYVLFAAEPYETIAFKVPSREVDKSEGKFWTLWNKDSKQFFLQFGFRVEGSAQINYSNVNSQNYITSNNNLINRIDRNGERKDVQELNNDEINDEQNNYENGNVEQVNYEDNDQNNQNDENYDDHQMDYGDENNEQYYGEENDENFNRENSENIPEDN